MYKVENTVANNVLIQCLTVFLILITFFDTYCQTGNSANPINNNYASYPDGENQINYPNGRLMFQFTKAKGKLQGSYIYYKKDGTISEKDQFDNGQFHGPAISFNTKGDTTSLEIYKHDTLLISEQWTYYKNGQVKDYYYADFRDSASINSFDKKDTSHKKYFEYDLNKLLTQTYNTDQFLGYYETGELKYKVGGIKWEYEGDYMEYFKNGHIKEKGYYKLGKLEGEYLIYNEDGSIKTKKHYLNGKLIKKGAVTRP